MRRAALYGAGWLVAAALAVVVSWQGVARVGTEVTNSHPRALTAGETRQALDRSSVPAGAASPAGADGGPGAGPVASSTTTTTAPARRPTATTSTTRPPTPPTTRPSGPAAQPSPAPQPTPPAPGGPSPSPATTGETRTYNLVGGSATLRFSPSGVSLVWADPNPGFQVEVDRSDDHLRVRFDSDTHRSEVEGWWDGGPQDRVDESGSGGGGSGGGGDGGSGATSTTAHH